jgi:hypothetical protein
MTDELGNNPAEIRRSSTWTVRSHTRNGKPNRAERATATARRLLDENDRWRRHVQRQLDFMFELSAEFRRPPVSRLPVTPPRPAAGDK